MNTTVSTELIYPSPFGKIKIVEKNQYITQLSFIKSNSCTTTTLLTPLLKKVVLQLDEYFKGIRKTFQLPLNPSGTPFQKKVWNELCHIPYGETRSYKQITEAIGCPKGSRAVGMANHHNPIGIIIPCHRVIGSNGKLVGYAGGLDKKSYLLELEQHNVNKIC